MPEVGGGESDLVVLLQVLSVEDVLRGRPGPLPEVGEVIVLIVTVRGDQSLAALVQYVVHTHGLPHQRFPPTALPDQAVVGGPGAPPHTEGAPDTLGPLDDGLADVRQETPNTALQRGLLPRREGGQELVLLGSHEVLLELTRGDRAIDVEALGLLLGERGHALPEVGETLPVDRSEGLRYLKLRLDLLIFRLLPTKPARQCADHFPIKSSH